MRKTNRQQKFKKNLNKNNKYNKALFLNKEETVSKAVELKKLINKLNNLKFNKQRNNKMTNNYHNIRQVNKKILLFLLFICYEKIKSKKP